MPKSENGESAVTSQINHLNILDELIEGVQILDHDLIYIYLNETAVKQSGKNKEDLIGKSFITQWPGVEKTELFMKMRNCLESHTSYEIENKFNFPDGRREWFQLHIQPVKLGILIMSLNITARKQIDWQIRERETFYHSLLDNLLNGFAHCQILVENDEPQDILFISANRAFEELIGFQNLAGKKFSELFPEAINSDAKLLEIFYRVARSDSAESFEYYFNATSDWLRITAYSPKINEFVFIFEVTTEQKKIEKKTSEQIEELQRWYEATLDRETRNIELKKEVNQLLFEAGKPLRYSEE